MNINTKMIICKTVYLPTLQHGSEICAILIERETVFTGTVMRYLRKCAGKPGEIELEMAKLEEL